MKHTIILAAILLVTASLAESAEFTVTPPLAPSAPAILVPTHPAAQIHEPTKKKPKTAIASRSNKSGK